MLKHKLVFCLTLSFSHLCYADEITCNTNNNSLSIVINTSMLDAMLDDKTKSYELDCRPKNDGWLCQSTIRPGLSHRYRVRIWPGKALGTIWFYADGKEKNASEILRCTSCE